MTTDRSDTERVLDADTIRSISAGLAPDPVDAALAARVKRRVLDRVAIAAAGHTVVAYDTKSDWKRFLPGIAIKVLQESQGVMSYLLKFEPGAVLPAHRHPHDEECVVIEGAIRIGDIAVGRGGYHAARKGSLDAPTVSDEGAVIYLRGAVPSADQLV